MTFEVGLGGSGGALTVKSSGTVIDPAATVMNFQSGVSATDASPGEVNVQGSGSSASQSVQYITLNGTMISAKQLTLAGAPAVPANTLVDVVGGAGQVYGTDFTVSGTALTWSGLGMESILSAGMQLRVSYFT